MKFFSESAPLSSSALDTRKNLQTRGIGEADYWKMRGYVVAFQLSGNYGVMKYVIGLSKSVVKALSNLALLECVFYSPVVGRLFAESNKIA